MDISKIKLGSTTYNVKDITARNNGIHYVTSPSGTAGTKDSNRTIWTGTVDGVTSLYTGLMVAIKVPLAGVNKGITLDINSLGEHPVVHNVNSIVTTHYAVGTILRLIYDADQTATVMVSGTNTTITGCWKLSLYDSNSDVQMRLYKLITNNSTWNKDYPLVASRSLSSAIEETDSKYAAIYGLIGSSTVSPTVNPITGAVKVKSLIFDGTTLESKAAAASGTDLSLVTTGEKATWNAKASSNTTYKINLNGTDTGGGSTSLGTIYGATTAGTSGQYLKSSGSGAPTWANMPTSLPASDVSAWAKESSKPSYVYSEIGYTINTASSAGGTVSVNLTIPLHAITLTGNVSAVSFSNAVSMIEGHSCHIIFYAAAAQTVVIANNHSLGRYCPNNEDITLKISSGGYAELDVLRIGNRLYIRGV